MVKINDDHMYHGAALTQIAEHPKFTAINAFDFDGKPSRSAFKINHNIGLFLKYATKPNQQNEYIFTFNQAHLRELKGLTNENRDAFLALVCVEDREICCINYNLFLELSKRREEAKEAREEQFQIVITIPVRKSFRVYVNEPGKRGCILGKEEVVSRKDFPGKIFALIP